MLLRLFQTQADTYGTVVTERTSVVFFPPRSERKGRPAAPRGSSEMTEQSVSVHLRSSEVI